MKPSSALPPHPAMSTQPTGSESRIQTTLTLVAEAPGAFLAECLWGLPGIDSVTRLYEGETDFRGIQVIGHGASFSADLDTLLAQPPFWGWVDTCVHQPITPEDWAESWKQYWHVRRLTSTLVIQPTWEAYTPQPQDHVLRLDPGSAFGTGTHDTTRMMLLLLEDQCRFQQHLVSSVLDVGTGSGILALYAACLGVPDVVGMDHDPHAVMVARENARENPMETAVCWTVDPLGQGACQRSFDLVLANLLAVTIGELLPDLERSVSVGGMLALGGITVSQYAMMQAALTRHPRLSLQRIWIKGDWITLVCRMHDPSVQ